MIQAGIWLAYLHFVQVIKLTTFFLDKKKKKQSINFMFCLIHGQVNVDPTF